MRSPKQRSRNSTLTPQIAEEVAREKGIDSNDPDFCLYDDTDPEALETLVGNTTGPFTIDFKVDDVSVKVMKESDGEIVVEVDSSVSPPQASD